MFPRFFSFPSLSAAPKSPSLSSRARFSPPFSLFPLTTEERSKYRCAYDLGLPRRNAIRLIIRFPLIPSFSSFRERLVRDLSPTLIHFLVAPLFLSSFLYFSRVPPSGDLPFRFSLFSSSSSAFLFFPDYRAVPLTNPSRDNTVF